MLRRLWANERGQAMALLAVALMALVGVAVIVVDVGTLYLNHSQCVGIADAAALAGAQYLPDNLAQAEAKAEQVAIANGLDPDQVTTSFSADHRSIQVNIERNVELSFASIFGINSSRVEAEAEAKIGVAASVPWIVPFVIPKPSEFRFDKVYVMRMYGPGKTPMGCPYPQGYSYPQNYKNKYPTYPTSSPYPYQFDYMNVNIKSGGTMAQYLHYLEFGFHETFSVGQNMFYKDPSSGGEASIDTFSRRISADSNSDYTKAKIGDPRVMLIPVVANMLPRNTSDNKKIKVLGFVGFFLERVYKNSCGETFWFEGRFLKDLNIGTGEVSFDPDADFGLRAIQLVR